MGEYPVSTPYPKGLDLLTVFEDTLLHWVLPSIQNFDPDTLNPKPLNP